MGEEAQTCRKEKGDKEKVKWQSSMHINQIKVAENH